MSPSPRLQALWEREEALLEAGDVAGATELNVATWVGPRAGDAARAKVREMQRHAFEVQLAAPPNAAMAHPDWQLDTITAPALLVSGAHDLPDFTAIATDLAGRLPSAEHVELDWAGHLPNLEDPAPVNELLLRFLAAD
jgi:pimeloyl-ACP methyl ester carboxylesterase